MKTLKIGNKREYKVVKANTLIQNTRYDLSLHEQKILLRLIQMIEPTDTEFKLYQFSILEFCQLCGINNSGKNYNDIHKAIESLANKSYWVQLENEKEILLRWIDTVIIDKKTHIMQIKLNDVMKPFLLQLKSYFTSYSLYYTIVMKSKYAIRLYELLKSYQNLKEKTFNIEKLKVLLDAIVYNQWGHFKEKVIDKAIAEINLLTDINVSYSLIKEKRSFVEITFYISSKNGIDERLEAWKQIENRLNKNQLEGQISIIVEEGIDDE